MLRKIIVALMLLNVANVHAQSIPADLTLSPITVLGTTFSSPIALRNAGDGSGRLFIVEKCGVIKIVKNGAVLATPFLSRAVNASCAAASDERGLLGLAFHPNFESNRKFYIAFTRSGTPQAGAGSDQVIVEYQASSTNPDVADVSTAREILAIPDIFSNHNGGDIHFGPDGYLYYGMGDGGSGSDPNEFAQNNWRKTVSTKEYYLLGKMLRLDIDGTTSSASAEMCGTVTGQTAQYRIPPGNPYAGSSNTCDEIYHNGLRNPWRFSFDRRTGEMWIADVGQNAVEEVDFLAPNTPSNLGWKCFEGDTSFFSTGLCNPPPSPVTAPVLQYLHSDAGGGFRCSISGGYSYRGPINAMQGAYFYADYCSGEVFSSVRSGNTFTSSVWRDTNGSPVGFGEDELGNLYLVDVAAGTVLRFSSASDNGNIFGHGFEG
jgi:hypothetical protein